MIRAKSASSPHTVQPFFNSRDLIGQMMADPVIPVTIETRRQLLEVVYAKLSNLFQSHSSRTLQDTLREWEEKTYEKYSNNKVHHLHASPYSTQSSCTSRARLFTCIAGSLRKQSPQQGFHDTAGWVSCMMYDVHADPLVHRGAVLDHLLTRDRWPCSSPTAAAAATTNSPETTTADTASEYPGCTTAPCTARCGTVPVAGSTCASCRWPCTPIQRSRDVNGAGNNAGDV